MLGDHGSLVSPGPSTVLSAGSLQLEQDGHSVVTFLKETSVSLPSKDLSWKGWLLST